MTNNQTASTILNGQMAIVKEVGILTSDYCYKPISLWCGLKVRTKTCPVITTQGVHYPRGSKVLDNDLLTTGMIHCLSQGFCAIF